jgi:hypothetical protein
MTKPKRDPAARLPKQAPKKTGKAGIGPKEVVGDLVAQDTARAASEQEAAKEKPEPELLKVPGNAAKKGRRQKELPGMEDHHLDDIEEMARDYADTRDKRMALNREESQLKEDLLALMKKYKKTVYRVEEMEIKIVVTEEKIKVRILEDKEE